MPELPEVETIRRQLGPQLIGAKVVEADAHPSGKFSPAHELCGARFTAHDRRGKFLIFSLDDNRQLVVHLGMTGKLSLSMEPAEPIERANSEGGISEPHLRAWWRLDDGRTLRFVDTRRFGRLRVVPTGCYAELPTLHHAGPEPWDPTLTDRHFHSLLGRSRQPIKTRLLSQRPVAGVGNIYADEALWLAEISPKATRLSLKRAGRLLNAIRTVLEQGIENGGTTLRDYRDAEGQAGSNQFELNAYGRSGEGCRRCGATLRHGVLQARSTTWCPACQAR